MLRSYGHNRCPRIAELSCPQIFPIMLRCPGRLLHRGVLQLFWSRSDTITLMESRQRIIDYGEVFTPPKLVSDMLDLVAHECERIDSRFLEPACGNGNFLAEVLRRKLLTVDVQHSKNVTELARARSWLYAVCTGSTCLATTSRVCRDRLLNVVAQAYNARYQRTLPDAVRAAIVFILAGILSRETRYVSHGRWTSDRFERVVPAERRVAEAARLLYTSI